MISKDRDFPIRLLKQLKRSRSEDFSGIGIVFYSQLGGLPSTPLGSLAATKPELPIFGFEAITCTLTYVSDRISSWHDGFHMIDMESESLTHLSQFLVPPLGDLLQHVNNRPYGARQMTALLTSMIPGIVCVGVLSTSGEVRVYENGKVLVRVTEKDE